MSSVKTKLGFRLGGLVRAFSSLLAGVLAYVMKLSAPGSGGNGFWDVLKGYGPFWPGTFGVRHIPSAGPERGCSSFAGDFNPDAKPLVTLFQIRIVLLVLIALLTIFVKIFSVVETLEGSRRGRVSPCFSMRIWTLSLSFS